LNFIIAVNCIKESFRAHIYKFETILFKFAEISASLTSKGGVGGIIRKSKAKLTLRIANIAHQIDFLSNMHAKSVNTLFKKLIGLDIFHTAYTFTMLISAEPTNFDLNFVPVLYREPFNI
jgi:hypothetical protein